MGDLSEANWNAKIPALKARLGIAAGISNGVPSRVAIVRAVVIPAVLFTATHVMPPAEHRATLNKMIKNYILKGTVDATMAGRWPTSVRQLQAGRDMGG